ncbi:MAG TPA: hypothetical protein PK781_06945 [Terrimesophilobacter sp.]|nr:hypothetical protein [Terrimesophilobacter sp.]HRQ00182.1 hypothetical protein [Terrimesophilobacter sp.]
MRRFLRTTALMVALALTVAGCTLWEDGENVVGQLREGFAAHAVLAELVDELRELEDVESAEAGVNQIHRTAGATVTLHSTAPAEVIADVATRVDGALQRVELQPYKREFTVRAGEASIQQSSFDLAPVDYAAELAYWHVIQSAIGPDITLNLGNDRRGSFQRILSTEVDGTVAMIAEHYDAFAAIPSPGSTETMWRLPGIVGFGDWLGPLPERSILTLMADMATVTNLLDDSVPEMPPGFTVGLSDSPSSFPPRFMLVGNMPGTEMDAAATWPLVLRMVRGAFETGLAEFQVGFQSWHGEIVESANFHVGDCADAHPPTQVDRKFVGDLAADGILLPENAAGICTAFTST